VLGLIVGMWIDVPLIVGATWLAAKTGGDK